MLEAKQMFLKWRHTHKNNKWTQKIPSHNIICSFLRLKVSIIDFLPQGTIIAVCYCDTLKKCHHTIQNRWCGMLSSVLLLHHNAWLHTATWKQELIMSFQREQIEIVSLPIAQNQCIWRVVLPVSSILVMKFKKKMHWPFLQAASFYEEGVQKLVSHYNKQ